MLRAERDDGSIHIAYLGPEASFSHQAAMAAFAEFPKTILHPIASFTSIFSALQSQSDGDIPYTYAVVPVENSTNGSVVQVLDLLSQCSDTEYPDLAVFAEHYLTVHHCLFTSPTNLSVPNDTTTSIPGSELFENIKTLYTHPQVWGQCTRFLSTHFPKSKVERIDVGSTSAAARVVSRDTTGCSAAIASSLAGELHKLTSLATNIEDEPGTNTTRFFIMHNPRRHPLSPNTVVSLLPKGQTRGAQQQPLQLQFKSLITFTVPHSQPGSLADALAVFRAHNFNLTSIDTRPSRRRNWHYVFVVECETRRAAGNDEEREKLSALRKALEQCTEGHRYLGSWVDMLQFEDRNEDD